MIGFVETPARIEPRGGGFLVTFASGTDEVALMLTLHAMTALCGTGLARIKSAQADLTAPAQFPAHKRRRA